ncbi:hypothetical protein [Mariniblastus fucicola]|nr:hypothetical protein [Mariniblastus fucicola]
MPDLDFDFLRSFFSLGASAAALASSIYLWLSRFKKEQPNLSIEQVSPLLAEFVWPRNFAELYQAIVPNESEGLVCLWTNVAVINNSTMPNAVLQIDAWVKLANGKWQPTIVDLCEEAKLPINVEPHSTSRLSLQLATKLPYDSTRSSNQDRVDQAMVQLAENRDVKIRIRGVKQKAFQAIVVQPRNLAETKFGLSADASRRAA